MKNLIFTMIMFAIAGTALAQSLDGSPYTSGKDPDIDMFMRNWSESDARVTHGCLIEHDVLLKGDPMKPPERGAVLKYVNSFTHGTLEAGLQTEPVILRNEQKVFFILSGTSTISGGREKIDLYPGICILIPANLKYVITNFSDEPLTMYIITEPIPKGFKPSRKMIVRDENTLPISSTRGHWTHIVKRLFDKDDGLGTLQSVLTVAHDPMTIGHPHSHNEGCEEVWTALKGSSLAFLGKQIRRQHPGTAYMIPPDGNTPHCNINTTESQIKLLYFSVRKDIE